VLRTSAEIQICFAKEDLVLRTSAKRDRADVVRSRKRRGCTVVWGECDEVRVVFLRGLIDNELQLCLIPLSSVLLVCLHVQVRE